MGVAAAASHTSAAARRAMYMGERVVCGDGHPAEFKQ
jgi:hypothetical protein